MITIYSDFNENSEQSFKCETNFENVLSINLSRDSYKKLYSKLRN